MMKAHSTSVAGVMVLSALLLGAVPTQAQERKLGLYAGYTFLKAEDGNLSGLRLSPEYRLNGFASLVGDVSAEKGTFSSTDTTLTSLLGGLRVKLGGGSTRLFVHALAGAVRVSSSARPFGDVVISVAGTGLGLDGGGGVEFTFRDSFRLRVGADYLRRKVDAGGVDVIANDVRATAGIVF